jgi:hypothetical protein
LTKEGIDMATVTQQRQQSKPKKSVRVWAPRMWEGCHFFAWLRLLIRGRFAVNWRCWHVAIAITCMSLFNTLMRGVQWLWYGRRIRHTQIRHAPIFIIGHWRTGTTLLHELMILDERHAFPTTYECMDPNHFLLSESFFTNWLGFLIPARRPMDNMAAGFDRPQEDEFALCMLGQPSPYLTIAFPNRPPQFTEYFDLDAVSPRALTSWKKTLLSFLKQLTFKHGKRLVLKSPPHTCRIKVLKDMFPDAIFIHIVRDPYTVYSSTMHLWKSLYERQGLQRPKLKGLEDYVFDTYVRMYKRLEETRHLVAPERFHELRYEDLIRDPINQMRRLYEHLRLGDFESVQPRLESYLEKVAGYETNKYELPPEKRAEIRRRWASVIERYGYDEDNENEPTFQRRHAELRQWATGSPK